MVAPNYTKGLPVLRSEWEGCQACELGIRRHQVGGAFVFGEGRPGHIMLIGEGPGEKEEKEGRPFVGASGGLLRDALKKSGLEDCVYISNCVACRSCTYAYDDSGEVKRSPRTGEPIIRDQTPAQNQIAACSSRLYEEIYLVDPLLIVTLGVPASEFLLRRSVAIRSECGTTHVAKIPGASYAPRLTAKRRQWLRKAKGQWVAPVDQNQVEYHCLLCLHPAFVLRNMDDKRVGSPLSQFVGALELAKHTYLRFLQETSAQWE